MLGKEQDETYIWYYKHLAIINISSNSNRPPTNHHDITITAASIYTQSVSPTSSPGAEREFADNISGIMISRFRVSSAVALDTSMHVVSALIVPRNSSDYL
ncbi:hypothetical protein EG329_000436 [Mollisiaceae sp. DMI_Dod_QoI]|nr:hypothetical protein EG329_000436 [Helotiales sp. DMI_Dod_QoI]